MVEVFKQLLKKGTVSIRKGWGGGNPTLKPPEKVVGCDLLNRYFHLERELFGK